ncbi:MAG: extracellular solute-binding protein [Pseudomonadota bacterium]
MQLRRSFFASLIAAYFFICTPCSAVQLRFIIPAGATTESSRHYYNLVREFELKEPEIKIEFEPKTNWDEVIKRVRDLVGQGRNAGLFVAEVSETWELEQLGLIQPFEDVLAEQGIELKEFLKPISVEFLGSSYCANKKFCGAPFFRSMLIAIYNLDQLKAAGIPEKQLPKTWDEFESMLEKLRSHSKKAPFLLGGDWYDWIFEATVIQAGGSLMNSKTGKVTLMTPAAVRALSFWRRLKDKQLLERSLVWKDTLSAFTAGRFPVIYYSSGGMETVYSNRRFAWSADMMAKDVSFGGSFGGGNLFMSANMSKSEKAAAVKFAKFLYQVSIQARTSAATGYLPVVATAFADPLLKERYSTDEAFLSVRQQLKYAKPKLMAVDNLKVREIIKVAIDRCLKEGVSAQIALEQAQLEVDKLSK